MDPKTNKHYIDTCIWLNLFKKEGDPSKGVPFWKLARNLLIRIEEEQDLVLVSTIILKELYHKMGGEYGRARKLFGEEGFVRIVKTTDEDYYLARIMEREHQRLSFFDYLHVAIAKRLKADLITRDKELLAYARKHISACRPEDLLR